VIIARYIQPETNQICLGLVIDEQIVDFRSAWAFGIADAEVHGSYNATLFANLQNGSLAQLEELLYSDDPPDVSPFATRLADAKLMPPVDARSLRDFYAFEQHVRQARKNRGLEMIPEWYEAPVFYFSNTANISAHEDDIAKPVDTHELDYELELAVVIGKEGSDIAVERAEEYIAGFTIFNDWSARDLQRREMKVGLGPAKGKDFASTLGPYLVTPDELVDRSVNAEKSGTAPRKAEGPRYNLTMIASVNGNEYSRGNARDMNWTFAELIAEASRNTRLLPGDVIGSGTVGTGCITEFAKGTYPWLQPGDVVELAIERLGVLRNRVIG
jgi:fumarylacetoacetate (FAA) hydrolase